MITTTRQAIAALQQIEKESGEKFLVVVDDYDNEYQIEYVKRHNLHSDNPYDFCHALKIKGSHMGCIKRGV